MNLGRKLSMGIIKFDCKYEITYVLFTVLVLYRWLIDLFQAYNVVRIMLSTGFSLNDTVDRENNTKQSV